MDGVKRSGGYNLSTIHKEKERQGKAKGPGMNGSNMAIGGLVWCSSRRVGFKSHWLTISWASWVLLVGVTLPSACCYLSNNLAKQACCVSSCMYLPWSFLSFGGDASTEYAVRSYEAGQGRVA